MKNIIIAIDGHSSTGKSTLAKKIAQTLSYVYVDTGAMYRAVSLYAMQNNFITNNDVNKMALVDNLPQIKLQFKYNTDLGYAEMYLNNTNVEKEIRTIEVSKWVSKIAEIAEVREKLVEQQQEMGKEKGIVMDGRDIGTVVFPNADVKLFMTANAETRAKRRFQELINKGDKITYKDVLENVMQRDTIDSNRAHSPLIQAKDAIVIDNSNLSKEQQFNEAMKIINNKINE